MNLPLGPESSPAALKTDPVQAARHLADLLRQTPEYEAFLKALLAVDNDPTVQQLSAEIRAHKMALQWGRDPDGQHTIELTRLELELGDLPAVNEYHRAEKNVSNLFRAVDETVSVEAGVEFAVNAEHSACACGG